MRTRTLVPNIFILLSVILFAVGGVLYLLADDANPVKGDTTFILLFFGLTFFAAGHLAYPNSEG